MDYQDELYEKAKQIVIVNDRASISLIQRMLLIGYNRAARIMESLEHNGVVSRPNDVGERKVILSPQLSSNNRR